MNNKRTWIYLLVILLAIFHQDFWLWNDVRLVFGFMPVGLAYHALYSVAAALIWALAVRYAWPSLIDEEKADTHWEANGTS